MAKHDDWHFKGKDHNSNAMGQLCRSVDVLHWTAHNLRNAARADHKYKIDNGCDYLSTPFESSYLEDAAKDTRLNKVAKRYTRETKVTEDGLPSYGFYPFDTKEVMVLPLRHQRGHG